MKVRIIKNNNCYCNKDNCNCELIQVLDYKFNNDDNKSYISIASINHLKKEIKPYHGYFKPNKLSKYSDEIAKQLNYFFNNN